MTKSVLVVDDDQDFLDLVEAVLTMQGYRVHCTSESAGAFEQALQLRPDVVLVDIVMPDVDGWLLIEQLKANPATERIKIVVCTAAASEATRHSALLRQWGSVVLLKPFELDALLAAIAGVLADDHPS